MTDLARENATLLAKLYEANQCILELRERLAAAEPKSQRNVHIPRPIPYSRAGNLYVDSIDRAEEYLGVFGLKVKQRSKSRVTARRIAWHVLRVRMPELSWHDMASVTGYDHATIIHGLRKLRARLEQDADLREFVDSLLPKAEAAE